MNARLFSWFQNYLPPRALQMKELSQSPNPFESDKADGSFTIL